MIRYLLSAFLTLSCLPAAVAAQGPAPYDIQLDLSFAKASGDEAGAERESVMAKTLERPKS